MAASGSFLKTFSTGYKLIIEWSESNVDTANNESDITVTAKLQATGSYHISSSAPKNISLTINGTKYTGTCTVGVSGGSTKTLMSKTVSNINHGSDGSKTVSISCTLGIAVTLNGSYVSSVSVSGSAKLTTIARASTISAGNGTLGTAQTITINKADSGFKHKIKWFLSNDTSKDGYVAGSADAYTTASSISWTPQLSMAAYNTSGTSISVILKVYTYTSGGSSIGSYSKTITLSIPASVKPSCSISVSDAMGYQSKYGSYLKGLSKLKVVISATTAYGSSISAYKTTANGSTYTSADFTTGVVSGTGALNIVAKVTDKRGRSGTATKSITAIDYIAPKVTKLVVHRCNADGTENLQGAYVKVTISAVVTALNSKNTAAYTLRYKKITATSWNTVTLSDLANKYSVTGYDYIFAADTGSSYNAELTVEDAFKETTKRLNASTAGALMHFLTRQLTGKIGVAFGKVAELNEFMDVGWDMIFRRKVYMDNYSDAEKFFYFHNDAYRTGKTYDSNKVYPHGGRVYGGNGASKTCIGWYDDLNRRSVWVYNDVDNTIDSDSRLKDVDVTPTLNTAYTSAFSGQIKARPFLRDAVIQARFTSKAIPANTVVTIATLPTGYRPIDIQVPAVWISGKVAFGHITTAGEIKIISNEAVTAGTYIRIGSSYLY